jgi:hypothetical protein
MASPSTAITRFDLSIAYAEFNLLNNMKKFIGLKVLPALAVAQEASDFLKIKIASYLTAVEDTRRAPKASYARDSFEWTTDSYALEEHGVEETVDDAEVERYGDIIRVEQIALWRAINRVLLRLEYDIAAAVFNTSTWTGSSLTTAAAVPWTTAATADPIADIDAAHLKVNSNCGEDANALVLTKKAFTAMIRTTRVEALLKYDASRIAGRTQQRSATMKQREQDCQRPLAALQVDQIIVARGFKNTADKGQTASLSRMWDNTMAMLCVVHDDGIGGDLENPSPQIGRTLFSTKNDEPLPGQDDAGLGSLIIDEYREENVRGSVLRPRNKRQVKILHPECGHLLTSVTA